jgi:hypothetical protein
MAKPIFIAIQGGDYWINVNHIVSIEPLSPDGLEITTNDGKGPYTVDDDKEMDKLFDLIEVHHVSPMSFKPKRRIPPSK